MVEGYQLEHQSTGEEEHIPAHEGIRLDDWVHKDRVNEQSGKIDHYEDGGLNNN